MTVQEWVMVLVVTVAVLLFPKMPALGDALGRTLERLFRSRS